MKVMKIIFTICILLSISLIAQTKAQLSVFDEHSANSSAIYPVDAQPMLERYYKEHGIDPAKEAPLALRKTTAWNYKVGDTKTFALTALNGATAYSGSPSFTCRAVGNWCYVFVEDSMWTSRVDQNAVDSVRIAFDSKTPANSTRGIYQTDTQIFGNPPDVDNDPKIIILIHNIRDGFSGSGGYVAGFFSSGDENGSFGNSPAEIYHLDCKPLNLKSASGIQLGMSTTAHEFQHMIHWNYVKTATTFFNEGFSLTAEVMNGYAIDDQSGYANETNHYLMDWRSSDGTKVLNDYSRAARFFLYVYEQFGSQFFTKYLTNKVDYINGMNNTLTQLGSTRQFMDIVSDWFMANGVNNKSVKSTWGYTYKNLLPVATTQVTNPNVTKTDNVFNLGSQYITFSNGKNLSIKFTEAQPYGIVVKAIKIGSGTPVVDNVTLNSTYNVPDFGTTYSKVTFVVYFASSLSLSFPGTTSSAYTYTATGSSVATNQELSYDTTAPTGVYLMSVGDTVAVNFAGVGGARLDSIRVALRNKVPIEGGVWRAGSSTFNGKKLSTAFKPAGIVVPTVPYPVPWTNWVKVDLKSQSIDASTSFNVCFIVDGVYETSASPTNRVMVTSIPGTASFHNYYYMNSPGAGNEPGWFYPGDGAGNIGIFLIRAYVTVGIVGIEGPVEILPASFSLNQNYPNPFNPSTIISYNLPKQSTVKIKIYDAIGNEVRSLINEDKSAGKYNILWDGSNNSGVRVASGVYYYRITAGDFVQTKKMILMK